MAKIIYFGSLKGGTGVTTVCVGLGLALAALGEKTLIVDGDRVSASAMTVAGMGNMQVYTLADYERAACRAKQAAVAHPKEHNLYLMPSLGLRELAAAANAVREVEGLFDFVLLDKTLPELCGEAAIVTEPYLPSVKSADGCKSALADGGIKDITLVVNKLNGGQVLAGEVLSAEKIAELLRLKLLATVPEDPTLAVGRWRKRTVCAFAEAANALCGKRGNGYNVLQGYGGLNGYIKRKMRDRI